MKSSLHWCVLAWMTLAGAAQAQVNPLDTQDPFVGVFQDDSGKLRVEIAPRDGGPGKYAGIIRRGDRQFAFQAIRKDNSIEGAFRSGESDFPFTATSTPDGLTLSSGQATHLLHRQSGTAAAPAGESPRALEFGHIYKHPTGGTLRYPDGWSTRETNEGLLLIAPQQQQDEVYVVTSEDAGGSTRVDDPALLAKVDALVAQQFPALHRKPEIEKLKSGDREGIALTWEGEGPTGVNVRARLYATILKQQVVSIVAVGAKDRVIPREAVLAQIFSSFAWAEAQLDPSLVSTWHYWSYSSSGLGGPNLSSTEIRRTLRLSGDGKFSMTGNTEAYISVKSENADASSASQRGTEFRGTWAAGNGKLYLTSEDGTYFTFAYRIQGSPGDRTAYVDTGGNKPQEWREKRIEP